MRGWNCLGWGLVALIASACGSSNELQSAPTPGSSSSGAADSSTPAPPVDDEPPECAGLECLPCAMGQEPADGCADDPDLEGTCCAAGDPIVQLSTPGGSEVVDAITDGVYAVGCGGFGAIVTNIEQPTEPQLVGTASRRCQNAAFGPILPSGERIVYVTHHGDSWVPSPSLQTFSITADGLLAEVDAEEDPDVLYEGLAVHDDILYVAAHGRGVMIYRLGPDGVPTRLGEVDGFDNAIELVVEGTRLFVADRTQGVHVLSIADPSSPVRLQVAQTNGLPRDIDVDAGRVYVALGSSGVDVFDVAEDGALVASTHFDPDGAIQQVDASGSWLAVAAWSHVAVLDAESGALLGTERTRSTPQFEQDLGVAVHDDLILAAEWENLHVLQYRPGLVAPDIQVDKELLEFDAAVEDSQVLVVRNRGPVPLEISDLVIEREDFTIDGSPTTLEPGQAVAYEVSYRPSPTVNGMLQIFSNDPDDDQTPLVLPLDATESTRLDVGDAIGPEFGFLDLEGTGEVSNLEGNVVVLAYFALF